MIKENGSGNRLSDFYNINSNSIRFSQENWQHVTNPLGRSKLIQFHKLLDRYKPGIYRGVSSTTTLFVVLPLMVSVLNTSPITAPGADLLISSGYILIVGAAIIAGYAFAQKTFALIGKSLITSKDLQNQKLEVKPELDKLQKRLVIFKDFLDNTKSCKSSSSVM